MTGGAVIEDAAVDVDAAAAEDAAVGVDAAAAAEDAAGGGGGVQTCVGSVPPATNEARQTADNIATSVSHVPSVAISE